MAWTLEPLQTRRVDAAGAVVRLVAGPGRVERARAAVGSRCDLGRSSLEAVGVGIDGGHQHCGESGARGCRSRA